MRDWLLEPMYITKHVCATLLACREHCGYSARHVAARLRVSHPTILAWERGETPVTVDTLVRLAQVYGCQPHEFFQQGFCPAAGRTPMERRTEFEAHFRALSKKWELDRDA